MRVQSKAALGLLSLAASSASVFAQAPGTSQSAGNTERFREIVPALLREANIKPGQTAVIRGSSEMIPLMEELTSQLERAGANTITLFTTNRIEENRATAVPLTWVTSPPSAIDQAIATKADIRFNFPTTIGNNPYAKLAPERSPAFAKRDSVWSPYFRDVPSVYINIPNAGDTTGTGLSFEQISARRWGGINADYPRIAATATALRDLFEKARSIRLTTPEGTDLTFSVLPNSTAIDAGPAFVHPDKPQPIKWSNLPGGEVYLIPRIETAHGKIHAPQDKCNVAVTDETMDLVAGRAENVRAGSDEECVRKIVTGMHLAALTLGLNPALSQAVNRDGIYLDDPSAGAVNIYLGNNIGFGGSLNEGMGWYFPLPRATLTADGVTVLKNGQLGYPSR